MNIGEAKLLIDKYLKGGCSPEERALLEQFLDSYQDQYTEHGIPIVDFDREIKANVWSKIQKETQSVESNKIRQFSFSSIYKIAAVLAGITIGLVTWSKLDHNEAETLLIPDDKIVLRMGNEDVEEIEVGEFANISDEGGQKIASQQGNVIVYEQSNHLEKLVYNEIVVPRGKKIKVILSDGTSVNLNSNSVFKFPVNFLANEDRNVFLSGEAYFEVAKDESRPFLVTTSEMSVTVLGTHFNVSSYEGSISQTVLLEGSVVVQQREGETLKGSQQRLVPGQKASVISGDISVKEVNAEDYIGWMYDLLIFDDEPFSEIVKKIERRYNVQIQNMDKKLSPVRFNGKFQEETVIDLLETFKESAGFTYRISDNKVIIN